MKNLPKNEILLAIGKNIYINVAILQKLQGITIAGVDQLEEMQSSQKKYLQLYTIFCIIVLQ